MPEIRWERLPLAAALPPARDWLLLEAESGLSATTVAAYSRAVEGYLAYCRERRIDPRAATTAHVAAYLRELGRIGLRNATQRQRLAALRLFYAYVVERGERPDNPATGLVGADGAPLPGAAPADDRSPWVPDEGAWLDLLAAASAERARTRVMLALAYDAALRREELCALATGDLDPAARLVRVRAEVTKGRRERVIPYSAATGALYAAYLAERRALSRARGPLFLSESRRNRARPISRWTWSKVVARLARRAEVPQFSTHTPRHLCLTDLARAGWELHEIALFAGHRHPQTTLRYIHLSGRELAAKLERGMAAIHAWRTALTAEVLG